MARNVRFLQNFIMTTINTVVNDDGDLIAQDISSHIHFGEIYPLDNWVVNGNTITLYFAENSTIKGVAPNVEKGFCEIIDDVVQAQVVAQAAQKSGGCGCGK